MSLSTANARRACRMCDLTNICVHTYSRCLQGSVANEGVMRSRWESKGSCPFRSVVLGSDEIDVAVIS